MSKFKLGFACKYMHADRNLSKKELEEIERKYNCRTTTLTWMRKQDQDTQLEKLHSIVVHNLLAISNMLDYIATLPDELRMFRLSSDILPLYSHSEYDGIYQDSSFAYIQEKFAAIGEKARKYNIKLSFHPGQYTVLSSDKPHIIENAIKEFEYHADMARWMGFGKSFQDGCKINIHVGGKGGPQKLLETRERLSDTAKNLITVENDEMSWGLEDCLSISHTIPVVMDIHHHWVMTGEYISADDDRVKQVIDSWQGVRPTMHYSISNRETILNHVADEKPVREELFKSNIKKGKLRAHSNDYWNQACNDWALTFTDNFDIMCESKFKNLASKQLYNQYLQRTIDA